MSSKNLLTLTSVSFENEVLKSQIPVLVSFWAKWYAPSRKMTSVVGELASIYEGRVKIAKLDVDECGVYALNYNIKALPTLILYKDGVVIERVNGVQTANAMTEIIDKHI